MSYTLNFIKVIAQVAIVATSTFVLPAALHSLVTFNFCHYLGDITSPDYQFGMGFVTVIVTITYMIAFGMEQEERAERKRAGLNQSLKF